ncbi:MAG TPA: 3-hydroxyacyl-CoA dehydrogenase family protein [Hanamia sp.]|nr:3-hydroxyacyl-CoA dehydrogenase family protein [Hanamia sp.]
MRIFILANKDQYNEIQTINADNDNELIFNLELPKMEEYNKYEAFFILSESWRLLDFSQFEDKPVFINSVIETLSDLKMPLNVNRLNAWPGFLQREIWEIVSSNQKDFGKIFKGLNRKIIVVKDEPGLVAARVISMIVNEAFFALGEEVSSKTEIDMAMKLGTNYPFGPFEWAEKIGLENIYHLLKKLSEKDDRYLPAPALEKIFSSNKTI